MTDLIVKAIDDPATARQLATYYRTLADQLADHARTLTANQKGVLERMMKASRAGRVANAMIQNGRERGIAITLAATQCRITKEAAQTALERLESKLAAKHKERLHRMALDLHKQGHSLRDIEAKTGLSRSTVHRLSKANKNSTPAIRTKPPATHAE